MATLSAVRDALKARLDVIAGLRVSDVFPEQVSPPAAIIMPPQSGEFADYRLTFGGDLTRYDLDVLVIVGSGTFRSGQDALDAYLTTSSTGSIQGAINADRTLGGKAITTFCGLAREYGGKEFARGEYLGAVVPVRIWTE